MYSDNRSASNIPVLFRCDCGLDLPASAETSCRCCGAERAVSIDGVVIKGSRSRLAFERADGATRDFIAACERNGWRRACEERWPGMGAHFAVRHSAADLIPVPDGSLLLDVNPGYGHITAQFARTHQVVALAGNALEARFLAVRKRQDELSRLTIMPGDIDSIRFSPGQFPAIIGMPPPGAASDAEFLGFLRRLQPLLAKGGYLYLSLPNRHAWRRLRSGKKHSGGWRCGYLGYRRIFEQAGLHIVSEWMSPLGYDAPCLLVPFQRQAMQYFERRWNYGTHSLRSQVIRGIRGLLAIPWLWRLIENDYVFLLKAGDA